MWRRSYCNNLVYTLRDSEDRDHSDDTQPPLVHPGSYGAQEANLISKHEDWHAILRYDSRGSGLGQWSAPHLFVTLKVFSVGSCRQS